MSVPRVLGSALLGLATVLAAAAVHAHGGKHGAQPAGPVTAEERAAFATARPVFEKHCFRCHTKDGRKAKPKSLAHLTMDRYPLGGHHAAEAGEVIRRVLGAVPEKKEPTMPSDDVGAVTGEDLAKVLAWADAFDRAHPPQKAAGAHHH
jgi:uncharacterized membrane protein